MRDIIYGSIYIRDKSIAGLGTLPKTKTDAKFNICSRRDGRLPNPNAPPEKRIIYTIILMVIIKFAFDAHAIREKTH